MEDYRIVDLYWERNEAAITESDRKYGKMLKSLSYSLLSSREDAEECVNDAYLQLWRTIPPTTPDSLEAYLLKTVRNLSLNRQAHNSAQKRGGGVPGIPLQELEQTLSGIELPEDSREIRRAINTFLAMLDKRDMLLFVRRYWYSDPAISVCSAILAPRLRWKT